MMSASDTASLVTLVAQNRSQLAFIRLYDQFAPLIKAWLLRSGLDHGLCDDITQDVMSTLWHKAHLYDPARSSLTTWLCRIARNRRIDYLRRDRLDMRDPASSLFDALDDSLPDAGHILDADKRARLLEAALSTLAPSHYELISLAFFEGLSHTQIADRTNLPLGTIKSRLRHSFSRLRQQLESAGITESL
jgi:RNA polymerase sigma-70 factor (ECF subfamily)